jgi:hypothetical protein
MNCKVMGMSGEHFATENITRQMEVVCFIPSVIYFKRQFVAKIKPNEDKHEENIFKRLHFLYYKLLFFTMDIICS